MIRKEIPYPYPQSLTWRDKEVFSFGKKVKIILCGNNKKESKGIGNYLSEVLRKRYDIYTKESFVSSKSDLKHSIILGLIDDEIVREIIDRANIKVGKEVYNGEGYLLDVRSERILVAGGGFQGLFYGIQTLIQIIYVTETRPLVNGVTIYDWPFKKVRGAHFYLPARENISFFKRLIDFLAELKYNTLFIEVGGGMEYRRHPEINAAWEKFAARVNRFNGGPAAFIKAQELGKNSTHTELAGGSYLKQGEVRDIVNYARKRYFEVIPEVLSLGHSYYLLQSHKDLAEWKDDKYPDTYCPSNPKTYELLFEVMEEVIEVFQPRIIHIGHDEVHFLKMCPRCRNKRAANLFAEDVRKIHDFLAERGIATAMWGEKLLNITAKGRKYGGAKRLRWTKSGKRKFMLETYPAVNMIPKDILILDWFWGLDSTTQDYFDKKGFKQIFGNFHPTPDFASEYEIGVKTKKRTDWGLRLRKPNVLGAEISSWCNVAEKELAGDGILFALLLAPSMLWWQDFSNDRLSDIMSHISAIMPKVRSRLGGTTPPSLLENKKLYYKLDLSPYCNVGSGRSQSDKKLDFLQPSSRDKEFRGVPFRVVEPDNNGNRFCLEVNKGLRRSADINVDLKVDSLVFFHTSSIKKEFEPSFRRLNPNKDIVGYYKIIYEDLSTAEVPIEFGVNIYRWDSKEGRDLTYFADPIRLGKKPRRKGIMVYAYEWVNPKPENRILKIKMCSKERVEGSLFLFAITGIQVS